MTGLSSRVGRISSRRLLKVRRPYGSTMPVAYLMPAFRGPGMDRRPSAVFMRWSGSGAPACSRPPSAVHPPKLIMEKRHTLFSQLPLTMGLSSLDSHMALA